MKEFEEGLDVLFLFIKFISLDLSIMTKLEADEFASV